MGLPYRECEIPADADGFHDGTEVRGFGARSAIEPIRPPAPPTGRLNIQIPRYSTPAPAVPPVYQPPENCNPCTSCYIVCQSRCEFQSTCQ